MTRTAKGTFEVKLSPEPPYDESEGVSLGRVVLDKTFQGDLVATSTGQMIGARSREVKASAGYVAIERVVGSLEGREGSFVLQHSGVMTRGTAELKVTVVPDTGTAGLSGITGRMSIEIAEGKHYCTFEYDFDAPPSAAPG